LSNPTESPPGPQEGRAALSRELADFLIELSIGLHKHAMYPEGHPSLAPAAERVAQRLTPLVADRGSLSLGVARDQLVIEGVATDSKNPVLADLAGRLHRHHLGAVTFRRGCDAAQIRDCLATIAVEADRTGQPLGLGPSAQLTAWSDITLYSLTYDALELVGGPEREQGEEEEADARTRADQLWVGLARAALASDTEDDPESEPTSTDPGIVARAIDQHAGGTAYDQVIVGYLLKIAEELRTSKGGEAAALKKRVSKLVSSLDDRTKGRLLDMGGDRMQRQRFMLNASEGMTLDAVVDLVKAWAGAEQQDISHSLVRMLEKLSRHAEESDGERRQVADASLREQVRDLVQGWGLADPNPGAYSQSLEAMSRHRSEFAAPKKDRFLPEPQRFLEMALEVDTPGERVFRAIDQLVEQGRLSWVIQRLEEAEAPRVVPAVWDYIGGGTKLREMLTAQNLNSETLDAVVERMGIACAEPMLDVLAETESTQSRRMLVDRLARFGGELGPRVVAWLDDPRWYVQRNMLSVLAELPQLPPDFNGAKFLQHADPRVRRQAVRVGLRSPTLRDRAVCSAISDSDERIVRMGLSAALESCPETAVALIVQKAVAADSEAQRLMAIQVLGSSGRPAALNALLSIAKPRRRSLLGLKPRSWSKESIAAVRALRSFGSDQRATRVLEMAAKSRDPVLERAARGDG
jgi:hypothetical protein